MSGASTDDRVRVRTFGASLELPEHEYRLVPGALLELHDALGVGELAAEHGAVLIDVLCPDDGWLPAVLFEVDVAWSVLESGDARDGVITRTRGDRTMALVGWEACNDVDEWDRAPAIAAPGSLASRLDDRRRRVWESASFRLLPHPILRASVARDWAHAWTLGWGPLSLTLEVARSPGDLAHFIEAWAPLPYARKSEHEWQEPSRHDRAPLLVVGDGRLHLFRSYHEPSDAIVAFDAGLLTHLAAGELGPLRWTLTDDDYGQRIAGGEDTRSLAAYLE